MLRKNRIIFQSAHHAGSGQGVYGTGNAKGDGGMDFVGSVLNFLYPPRCPICEKILLPEEGLVCKRCYLQLPFVQAPFCRKCGKPVRDPEKELCFDCGSHPRLFDEGRAVFLYEKDLRGSVDRLKFCNRREYIPFYGFCLARLSLSVFPIWRPEYLIPVPMHSKKKLERGFDQAALLSAALTERTSVPTLRDFLVRTRYTSASKGLGRSGRRKNLRGAFAVNRKYLKERTPERIVLIDDIYTTGATMNEATYALLRAGLKHVYFLTVCIGRGAE